MLIDKYASFGEGLSLETAGVIGNALDLGAAYNVGAGANRPPVLHVVAQSAVGAGALQLCASDDGATAKEVLVGMTFGASEAGTVLFSGMLPAVPKASGRYLVLKNASDASSASGTVSAYMLNHAPAHHVYPDCQAG